MKRTVYILLFLLIGINSFAQKNEPSPWDNFGDNWYLDAGIGIQTLFTPDWGKLSMGKQLTPSYSIGIGKWFNPYWGMHFNMDAYSLNGYRSSNIGDIEPFHPLGKVDLNEEGAFRYYLRYMGMHADFRFSLLNLIAGKERTAPYDVIPYIGFGYVHAFPYRGTIKQNLLTGHLGVRQRYTVNEQFDINLDITAQTGYRYMHPTSGHNFATLSLSVGASWYFGKKAFRKSVINVPIETVRYVADTIYVREVEVPGKDRIIERIVSERTENPIMASIRFGVNSSKPLEGQDTQIFEVGRFLRDNPNATILIEGYADATTGSSRYNKRLGMQRAERVKKLLVQKYNISEQRIETQAIGADEQPYKEAAVWNCVAIIKLIK